MVNWSIFIFRVAPTVQKIKLREDVEQFSMNDLVTMLN